MASEIRTAKLLPHMPICRFHAHENIFCCIYIRYLVARMEWHAGGDCHDFEAEAEAIRTDLLPWWRSPATRAFASIVRSTGLYYQDPEQYPLVAVRKPPLSNLVSEARLSFRRTGLASLFFAVHRPGDAKAAAVDANAVRRAFGSRSTAIPHGDIESAVVETWRRQRANSQPGGRARCRTDRKSGC